jgi:hypothetical protein
MDLKKYEKEEYEIDHYGFSIENFKSESKFQIITK